MLVALLKEVHDPESLPGPPEPSQVPESGGPVAVETAGEQVVESPLARRTERRLAEVVPEGDRLDEVLVEPERPAHRSRELGDLEGVGQAVPAVVLVRGEDPDLRLLAEASERAAVHDSVPVPLELGSVVEGPALVLDRVAARVPRSATPRARGPLPRPARAASASIRPWDAPDRMAGMLHPRSKPLKVAEARRPA